jgi:hypothetical protein
LAGTMQLKTVLTTDGHGLTRIRTGFGRKQLTALINRRGAEAQRRERRKRKPCPSSFLIFFSLHPSALAPPVIRGFK